MKRIKTPVAFDLILLAKSVSTIQEALSWWLNPFMPHIWVDLHSVSPQWTLHVSKASQFKKLRLQTLWFDLKAPIPWWSLGEWSHLICYQIYEFPSSCIRCIEEHLVLLGTCASILLSGFLDHINTIFISHALGIHSCLLKLPLTSLITDAGPSQDQQKRRQLDSGDVYCVQDLKRIFLDNYHLYMPLPTP